MKRRTVLGLAGSTLGASLVVGSSAYNIARAERDVNVEVINDTEAYLRLRPLPTYADDDSVPLTRSDDAGDVVRFQFPGTREELDDLVLGDGLGEDSEYYFDSLVEVGNQGTEIVEVYTSSYGDLQEVTLYDSADSDRQLLSDETNSIQLAPGEAFEAGVYINTFGVETGSKEQTLKIAADATSG